MLNSPELTVVEWSHSQKAFHIHELSRALEMNLRSFLQGGRGDFIPIGIFENDDDLKSFMSKARSHRDKKIDGLPGACR